MNWKSILAKLIDQYEGSIRDGAVWLAVAGVTWGIAALRTWIATPDDGLTLAMGVGSDAIDPTYNLVSSAGLAVILRFLAPLALKLLLSILGALAVLLVVSTSASAAEIVGPDAFRTYTIGEYRATIASTAAPLWFVTPRDQASIKRIGNDLILTGPPGRYTIDLAEITMAADNKSPSANQVTRVVEIVADAPPQPYVPPEPYVPPVNPDGFMGFSKWAVATAGKLSAADRSAAGEVADMLDKLAKDYAESNNLLVKTAEYLNGRGAGWSGFREDLRQELIRQKFNERTPADFRQAWNAVGAGLRHVK